MHRRGRRGALDFCAAFQREHVQTQAFVTILQETDLLMPCQANMTLKSGEQLSLAGFQVVDAQKLNALSDKAFLALRGSNGLAHIYSHLVSQGSWQALVDLSANADSGKEKPYPADASGSA
ncbi:MAG: SapC family protein [Alphaproteobacteria bacterium]|nr:SapC family protein [Alphaproteobacteria bacterium]